MKICNFKTRLGSEICSSDVKMHKDYCSVLGLPLEKFKLNISFDWWPIDISHPLSKIGDPPLERKNFTQCLAELMRNFVTLCHERHKTYFKTGLHK